ncbi:hypothetical protein FSP39_001541 [Pinctada imbricata]|uniref:RING-type domain-containing protein n=1 Tax=Pinctada imbricata TaxID=66713 RepID=A0AA88XKM2_PINIB|nr:hypothetical protein FSP39_001541 [Pinctada imbricata]
MSREEDKHRCTVCAYDYCINERIPRLLPCQHTLCSLCIENILVTAEGEEEEEAENDRSIKCPICRKRSPIPINGISYFLENYFVDTNSDIRECDLCQNSGNSLRECSICNSTLCELCFISHEPKHKEKTKKKQTNYIEERTSRLLRWAWRRYENKVSTLLVAKLSNTLYCDCSKGIRKIIPTGKGVWVQSNTPLLSHFDGIRGRHNRVELHDTNVIDICSMGFETLAFVDSKGDIYVWNIHTHSKKFLCSLPGEMKATSIFVKDDELLLISTQKERADGTASMGYLLMYDLKSNTFFETDEMIVSEMRLRLVTAIDIHPITGSWFLCDYDQGCVVIFSGMRICRYEGKLSVPKIEHTEDNLSIQGGQFKFRPRTLCCDHFRHTLVYDVGTKCIHVINDLAKLNWIVFIDDLGPVGDPNCLTFDESGKLWMGDKHSGTIRVYYADRYYNIYEGGEEPDGRLSMRDLTMGMSPELMALMSSGPIRFDRGPNGELVGIRRELVLNDSQRSNMSQECSNSSDTMLEELHERARLFNEMTSNDPDFARYLQSRRESSLGDSSTRHNNEMGIDYADLFS